MDRANISFRSKVQLHRLLLLSIFYPSHLYFKGETTSPSCTTTDSNKNHHSYVLHDANNSSVTSRQQLRVFSCSKHILDCQLCVISHPANIRVHMQYQRKWRKHIHNSAQLKLLNLLSRLLALCTTILLLIVYRHHCTNTRHSQQQVFKL